MWKLTIEDDEQKQISLPLVHNEYAVGRDDSNEIRLTERNISRKHAVLRKNGEGWVVRDLESYNGTYVNGTRVAGEQHVVHTDIVQLGDYRLEFHDEGKLQPAVPEQTATMPVPLAPHHRPDRLVVVVGPQPGQEFFLDREHFSLGRSEEADISVNHSSVSRLHAELFAVGNGRYEIIDKGSANGIRINGQEVRRGFIEAGDALELGDVRLRFVGAGKTFRAGFDRSQALPAVTGLDLAIKSPQKATAQGSSILKMVGVGALLGVVGVGATAAYVATRPRKPTPPTTASATEEDAGLAILEEAKALYEKGEIDKAHEQITQIPEGSAALKDPAVTEIEGAWADKLFKEAEGYPDDPQKQVERLWKIATTPTVDEGRRRKAGAKLKEVGVEVPDDPAALIKPGTPMPTSFTRPPPKPTASVSARAPGTPDREAIEKPKSRMQDLQARMPTLGKTDLLLLIGLCQQEGNMQCAQAAAKRLGEVNAAGTSAPSSTPPKR